MDKVVLITGASGSIGRGTALAFAKEGCKLALTGRDQERLDATSKACQEAGVTADRILVVTGDATKADDAKKIVDSAVEKFGALNVLVNTAGVIRPGVFLNTKMTDYDDVFNTNLRSVFVMCKAAMKPLEASKGAIVNVSSFTGRFADKINNTCSHKSRKEWVKRISDYVIIKARNDVYKLHNRFSRKFCDLLKSI